MERLIVDSDPALLAEVLSFAAGGLPPGCRETLRRVELAVEELFINICSHAYPGAAGPVEITRAVVLDEDGVESLVITFSDCGSPFNPFEDAPPPDLDSGLEERRPGGLGILLVKSVADRFAHRGTGNGNETEIRFRARP